MSTKLHPRIIVQRGDDALTFYREALGAEIVERYADPHLDGLIVHAALRIGGGVFTLAEERREWGNLAPPSLGGTPVLIELEVEDARAVGERMCAAGAEVIIPIEDRFYGKREGRLRDPFGHLWVISQTLEALSPDEIDRRMRAGT